MKITTLNLQGFENWQERSPRIVDFLEQEKPDVVFLQEAVYLPEISPFNNAQLLNQKLGYEYEASAISRLQVGREYPVYREGLAVLSRFAISKSDVVILKQAEGDKHNRIVQLVDIETPDGTIKVANVHFSITDFTDFATAHLAETLDILEARDEQRIIAGDFNLRGQQWENTQPLWQENYVSSSSADYVSFPKNNDRVDYVLAPKAYDMRNITTSPDDLSDHRALTVEIDSI